MANERHPIIAHGELYVEPISKKSNYINKSYPHEYEDAKSQLSKFQDYSEDNIILLTAVGIYNDLGADMAGEFLNAILPEMCSAELKDLIFALFISNSCDTMPIMKGKAVFFAFFVIYFLK